jgi:hypothetical protein
VDIFNKSIGQNMSEHITFITAVDDFVYMRAVFIAFMPFMLMNKMDTLLHSWQKQRNQQF